MVNKVIRKTTGTTIDEKIPNARIGMILLKEQATKAIVEVRVVMDIALAPCLVV